MFKLKTLTKLFNKLMKSFGKLLTKRNIIVFALFVLLYVMSSSFDLFEGIANKLQNKESNKRTVHQNTEDKASSKMMLELNKNNLSAKVNKKFDSCLGKYDCDGDDTSNIKTIPFIDTGCIAADGHKLKAKDDNDCARQKRLYPQKKQTALLNNN